MKRSTVQWSGIFCASFGLLATASIQGYCDNTGRQYSTRTQPGSPRQFETARVRVGRTPTGERERSGVTYRPTATTGEQERSRTTYRTRQDYGNTSIHSPYHAVSADAATRPSATRRFGASVRPEERQGERSFVRSEQYRAATREQNGGYITERSYARTVYPARTQVFVQPTAAIVFSNCSDITLTVTITGSISRAVSLPPGDWSLAVCPGTYTIVACGGGAQTQPQQQLLGAGETVKVSYSFATEQAQ